MIAEDYVSFEVAKLLKEKGFEGDILMFIDKDNVKYDYILSGFISDETIQCPTHQIAMKWLREVHKLPINIWYDKEEDTPDDEVWTSEIAVDRPSYILVGSFASYEQAVEAALKYCLENLI